MQLLSFVFQIMIIITALFEVNMDFQEPDSLVLKNKIETFISLKNEIEKKTQELTFLLQELEKRSQVCAAWENLHRFHAEKLQTCIAENNALREQLEQQPVPEEQKQALEPDVESLETNAERQLLRYKQQNAKLGKKLRVEQSKSEAMQQEQNDRFEEQQQRLATLIEVCDFKNERLTGVFFENQNLREQLLVEEPVQTAEKSVGTESSEQTSNSDHVEASPQFILYSKNNLMLIVITIIMICSFVYLTGYEISKLRQDKENMSIDIQHLTRQITQANQTTGLHGQIKLLNSQMELLMNVQRLYELQTAQLKACMQETRSIKSKLVTETKRVSSCEKQMDQLQIQIQNDVFSNKTTDIDTKEIEVDRSADSAQAMENTVNINRPNTGEHSSVPLMGLILVLSTIYNCYKCAKLLRMYTINKSQVSDLSHMED